MFSQILTLGFATIAAKATETIEFVNGVEQIVGGFNQVTDQQVETLKNNLKAEVTINPNTSISAVAESVSEFASIKINNAVGMATMLALHCKGK